MNKKLITILLNCLLVLSWGQVRVDGCTEDCGTPPGNPGCYECEDGVWVLKDTAECGKDSDCSGWSQVCADSCVCMCYAPQGSTSVSRSTGLDTVANKIESYINSIPRVTASGFGATASFSGSKSKHCCDPHAAGPVDKYCLGSSVNLTGTVGVDIPALGWSWAATWEGYESIDCSLGVTITPTVTVSAGAAASGCESECGTCFMVVGEGDADLNLNVTAGGTIALHSQVGWKWMEFTLSATATAQANVSTTAWANGAWRTGDCCCWTGFKIYCYGVLPTEAVGILTFEVGPWDYSVASEPITLIDGVHVHPTYDPCTDPC